MKSLNLPAKAATLHDVAREAGVSAITASRALNHPGMVSAATIDRVLAAVQKTGYVPNLLAGGLKSKRSMTVAGLVTAISVPQFLPTLRALTETLDADGYHFLIGETGYTKAREEKLLNAMISRRPDGIVVTGQIESPAARELLKRTGIPVVETWDLSEHPLDMMVGFSHLKVGSAIAGFFLSKGWRRLGIATGSDHVAMARCEGFLAAAGHDVPTAIIPAPSSVEVGRQAMAELLRKDPKIEAVYCSSDGYALGAMIEAQSRGRSVPDDLAICGFGDADFAAHLLPSLTTVQVDGEDMGRRAAKLIIDRCAGRVIEQPVIDLGFRIVERESTGMGR